MTVLAENETLAVVDLSTFPHTDSTNTERRRMTRSWVVATGTCDDGPYQSVVELTTQHHGRADYIGPIERCYDAVLSHHHVIDHGGYKITRTVISYRGDGVPSLRVHNVPTERYSAKGLRETHRDALILLAESLDRPSVRTVFAKAAEARPRD